MKLFGLTILPTNTVEYYKSAARQWEEIANKSWERRAELRERVRSLEKQLDVKTSQLDTMVEVSNKQTDEYDRQRDQYIRKIERLTDINDLALGTIQSQVAEILDQHAHLDVLEETVEEMDELIEDYQHTVNGAYELVSAYEAQLEQLRYDKQALQERVDNQAGTISDLYGRLKQADAVIEASQRQALRY